MSKKSRITEHLWVVYGTDRGRQLAKDKGIKIDNIHSIMKEEKGKEENIKEEKTFWLEGDPKDIQVYGDMFYRHLKDKDKNCIVWLSYYMTLSNNKKVIARIIPSSSNTSKRCSNPMVVIWEMIRDCFYPLVVSNVGVNEDINNYRLFNVLQQAYFHYSENLPFIMIALGIILYDVGVNKTTKNIEDKDNILGNMEDLTPTIEFWRSSPALQDLLKGNYNLTIDNYVIDKHTQLGKKRGATREDFIKEGSKIENASTIYHDPLLLEIYNS